MREMLVYKLVALTREAQTVKNSVLRCVVENQIEDYKKASALNKEENQMFNSLISQTKVDV